jgi:ADP-ribose pyrophosphatase YjhB (NUDIX family)
MELDANRLAESGQLARRLGEPARVDAVIDDGFFDPIRKPDRVGEVCMVIRRKNAKLLLAIKTFYPRGAYRLPTGGIRPDESIHGALERETKEETGLDTHARRFLAVISYRPRASPGGAPIFHTFAFLLDEAGGTLGTLDANERIEEFVEIDRVELPAVADRLERVTSAQSADIGGDWADWGRFRAVVHRVVDRALG